MTKSPRRFPAPDPERAAQYRADGRWRGDTIHGLVAAHVASTPDKLAVVDAADHRLTYAELDDQSARVASFLTAQGIGPGDIVTVCLPNWTETVSVFLGAMRIGAVVNPLPVTNGRAEITHVLRTCDSRALFVPDRFRSTDFDVLLDEIDADVLADRTVVVLRGRTADLFPDQAASGPSAIGTADDPAAVLFTSGTESRAKGAVHTHDTILFGERVFGEALRIGADDVAFMASPISHTTGYVHGVVMTLTTGGTLVLLDVFRGDDAVELMSRHACTWTMGATPFLADTAAELVRTGERLPALRYFLCGGAPIPEVLVRRASDLGMRVLSIYGATESPPHTLVHPDDPVEHSWTTDGRPLAGIEVRIVDELGNDRPVGEPGEEWSRGPNTFLGYLGEPELTTRALDDDGWYHSGDLARLLPDGSIRITGRLKDIIVRGGQNISVREVEDHLAGHPMIERAAVVGVPHDRLGETTCAVVVPTAQSAHPTLDDVTSFLRAKGVATYKLPERLEVWEQLPMNPSGKIQKFRIKQQLDANEVAP